MLDSDWTSYFLKFIKVYCPAGYPALFLPKPVGFDPGMTRMIDDRCVVHLTSTMVTRMLSLDYHHVGGKIFKEQSHK